MQAQRALRISNYPWIGFVLRFAIVALSPIHIGTNPTVTIAPTTPDDGSFKTIRYLPASGMQTNFQWPLSIAGMRCMVFYFHALHSLAAYIYVVGLNDDCVMIANKYRICGITINWHKLFHFIYRIRNIRRKLFFLYIFKHLTLIFLLITQQCKFIYIIQLAVSKSKN